MERTGVIEAVGEKFNGSVKVGGEWFSFNKFYKGDKPPVGTSVALTLKEWEFNGKKGINIESLAVLDKPVVKSVAKGPVSEPKPPTTPYPGRDFDREARGKTLCQYLQAQLSNPSVDVTDLDGMFSRAKELVERTFKF